MLSALLTALRPCLVTATHEEHAARGARANEGIERGSVRHAMRARSSDERIIRQATLLRGVGRPVISQFDDPQGEKLLKDGATHVKSSQPRGLRDAFRRLFITSHSCRQYFRFFWSNRD